jgi:uncharacterized protein YlxW (UPF0749 family)
MGRRVMVLAVLGIGLCLCGGLMADDTPGKSQGASKARRALPTGWSKLGLSDQQKKQLQAVQAQYGSEIEILQARVKQLQEEQRHAMYAVLTEAQKTQLKEIIGAKAGEVKDHTNSEEVKEKSKR